METVTVDLSDLAIHQLDVDPREAENAVEFQLHATLRDVDDDALAAIANGGFVPEKIVGSVEREVDGEENVCD